MHRVKKHPEMHITSCLSTKQTTQSTTINNVNCKQKLNKINFQEHHVINTVTSETGCQYADAYKHNNVLL